MQWWAEDGVLSLLGVKQGLGQETLAHIGKAASTQLDWFKVGHFTWVPMGPVSTYVFW